MNDGTFDSMSRVGWEMPIANGSGALWEYAKTQTGHGNMEDLGKVMDNNNAPLSGSAMGVVKISAFAFHLTHSF